MKKSNLSICLLLLINTLLSAQWVPTGGPSGGNTYDIAQAGTSLVVAAGRGGVFKSVNNGVTWEPKNTTLPSNINAWRIKESNGLLYLITTFAIYISSDEGENWELSYSGIDSFSDLTIQDGTVYVYSHASSGVLYSEDNGANWVEKRAGNAEVKLRDLAFFNSAVYGGGQSLFRSSDNGDTWDAIEVEGLGPNGISSMTATEEVLYIADDGHVFSSHNGDEWVQTNIDLGGTILTMGISGDSVYLTTGDGMVFYTKDEGQNWTKIQNTKTNSIVNSVTFLEGKIVMCTSEGLFSSIDAGATWYESNYGMTAMPIESLAASESSLYVGTKGAGIFRSDLKGNWVQNNSGLSGSNALSIYDIIIVGDSVFLGSGGGVYAATIDGDSWTRLLDPGLNKSIQALHYDNGVFAAAVNGTGVYISNDKGNTWVLASNTGLNTDTSYESIYVQGDTIIVSNASLELFVSQDLGATWTDISIEEVYTTREVQIHQGRLYAGSDQGLYFSDDLGVTWVATAIGVYGIHGLVVGDGNLFVATNQGMFLGSDKRDEWYDVSDQLTNKSLTSLILAGDHFYAGTNGASVWQRNASEVNLPPIILEVNQTLIIEEDTPLELNLSHLSVDDDSDFPGNFTLTINDGENYSVSDAGILPDPNFNGLIHVDLTVNDGVNNSAPFWITIEVTPVNDIPVVTGTSSPTTTPEDTPLNYLGSNLLVEDPDNTFPNDFTIYIRPGDNYLISQNQIIPDLDFNGVLSVPIVVNDGIDSSEEFELQVNVTPVNDVPVINGNTNTYTTPEETGIQIPVTDFSIVDPDNAPEDFTLNIIIGENYTVSGNEILPNLDFNGILSVPITVNDGEDNSEIFNLSLEVTAVNDVPIITGINAALFTLKGTPVEIPLTNLLVEDPDNDFPNDFTLNVLPGDLYSVSGNTVLPSADFTGTLTVSVYVNDGTDDSEPFNISLEVFKALELESATSNTWEVYPNPTKDWLIIKSNNLSDAFQIKIYGMNGELIKGLEQITSVNHTIDLSSLQPGMYLLQILDGAKEHTVRFMKE
ncbi:T9SS type A sorting domain-containing protein [Marinoscillum sp. 108]|uniref:T9SS type A sorting domain-containing protein n=1 Tax=Marinoscillum sp. 108 TaxID=2653151 RepID=UPI0012F1DC04|nr:T9SS type A sorting domain-containing protein [Marinoscillum sp. 108]VXD10547.1 Por secretion system C-terminal sorting domain-containing protein (modular protein) [Marinoscillum sp. 108]